ncbi:hypothetical protein [Candidatus Pantoea persica]|uniref:hypothetical protein n=1 Tax=Candidatus Pantoea persica TaxID=2518128 RepID=UPI00215D6732|nr:hypothetical protein [Candidatus Pantoea persica]
MTRSASGNKIAQERKSALAVKKLRNKNRRAGTGPYPEKTGRFRLFFRHPVEEMRRLAQIVSDSEKTVIFLLHPAADLPKMRVT